MTALFFLCVAAPFRVRLTNPIGASKYIPRLDQSSLTSFLRQTSLAVIFHANPLGRTDFTDFAIKKFSANISFAFGPESSPSIVAYRDGRAFKKIAWPMPTIGFTVWCKQLLRPPVTVVRHPETLRQVFDSPGIFFLSIDIKERPPDIPAEYAFVSIRRSVFGYYNFGINMSRGLYCYRSSDRQLLKVTGKPRNYIRSALVDLRSVNVSTRPFYGGFFLNEKGAFSNETMVLIDLAAKYPDVYFSLYSGDVADQLAKSAGFLYLQGPFLVLFRSNESLRNHWVVSDLKQIPDILAGKVDYIHASGPKVNKSTLVYNDYDAVLNSTDGDKIVFFTSGGSSRFPVDRVFEKFASLVRGPKFHLFTYNTGENEFPDAMAVNDARAVVLYPDRGRPLIYDGGPVLNELLHFTLEWARNELDISDDVLPLTQDRDEI